MNIMEEIFGLRSCIKSLQ